MSSDFHHLPITPTSPSLASHLQALDLLAARLASLSTRAEWETRVPLNSKASISGKIVNTHQVKINIGGEWWVDMTPLEAESWIRRRKAALLEEHAKVLEGWRPGQEHGNLQTKPADASTKPSTRFDPVFRSPVTTVDETPAAPAASQANATTPKVLSGQEQAPAEDSTVKLNQAVARPEQSSVQLANAAAGPSQPRSSAPPPQTIQDALATFMEKQEALAKATGKSSMPNGNAGEAMVNEEGLPIHEIREDENGELIGDLPTLIEGDETASTGSITEVPDEEKERADFWSDTAAARRAALRRKVFDDSPDSSSDDDDDRRAVLPPTPPEPSRQPPRQFTSPAAPSINAIPPTPSSPHPPSPPAPVRRPSSSAIPGKSILKPSAPRKKSVSFDSSVPEPPDSPGPSITRIGGSMFPTPVINIESGIEEKRVPVLNAPKPSPKRATFGDPFAGFKPGFLSGGSKSNPTLAPPTPIILSDEPESDVKPEPKHEQTSTTAADSTVKKPSLFAQRQRATEEADEPVVSTSRGTAATPSFPAISQSKGTSSVQNIVLEKPPPSRPSQTAGVAQTVTERPTEPTAGPSRKRLNGQATGDRYAEQDQNEADLDYDEDEDEDDDDFYQDDDDEEEEYDLDDAMLAREVALAYHQNRAYTELGRPRSSQVDNEEDEDYDGGEGGVMMALPEISVLGENGETGPRIVNPTPDSLRRFVRVGKLDNGKLVLAPGESGWSDEEEGNGQDDQQERKENKEEIKRALLGQSGLKERNGLGHPRAVTEDMGMPPTIGQSTPSSTVPIPQTLAVGGVKEKSAAADVQVVNPPKKVSRFKADRMGNA